MRRNACARAHSDTNNTMALEEALCSVVVDDFLMKSGAVCLPYATHGFQPQRHRVGENKGKTKDRQGGENKELGEVLMNK